jgi:two-component system, LuxR family, response regulator FixJ
MDKSPCKLKAAPFNDEVFMTTHIHLVDDDPVFLQSLAFSLDAEDLELHSYTNAKAFLRQLYELEVPVDVIVSDMRMPMMSGLELQASLKQLKVCAPLIFMTAHGDVALAVEAMRHGAFDFIEKPFQPERLLSAIKAASVPPADAAITMDAKPDPDALAQLQALSLRERQVLDLVLFGERNKVIADKIGISIKTVEMHRARLMAKMKAQSLAELVRKTLGYTPSTHGKSHTEDNSGNAGVITLVSREANAVG